jgi:elongation factor 2
MRNNKMARAREHFQEQHACSSEATCLTLPSAIAPDCSKEQLTTNSVANFDIPEETVFDSVETRPTTPSLSQALRRPSDNYDVSILLDKKATPDFYQEEHEDVRVRQACESVSSEVHSLRNVSIIAHVDHGKTTLADSLLGAAAVLNPNKVGDQCALDTGLEAEKGITIHSTAIALHYTPEQGGLDLTVNLIDSPGHVDFNAEVTAALRLTDGALVVVDVVEGVCVQTRKVLQQALSENVQPVLVLNKFDRLILEKQLDPDAIWLRMQAVISQVNNIITVASSKNSQSTSPGQISSLSLQNGTVCFGSGYYGWFATVDAVIKLYSMKVGSGAGQSNVLRERLCGSSSEKHFKKLVLAPIAQIHNVAVLADSDKMSQMLTSLLGQDQLHKLQLHRQTTTKALLRTSMRALMPAATTLLQLIACHLPSPAKAQGFRASVLHTGAVDDCIGSAIRLCSAGEETPVMCFVSKMVPIPGSKSYFALARVFSGTLRRGQVMYACGVGMSARARVSRLVELTGHGLQNINEAPAGYVCGILGLDGLMTKSGTISSDPEALPLIDISQSVSPVVSCAVTSSTASGATKLAEALRSLSKSDPCVQCNFDRETSQHVVSCAGELHLEVCMERLQGLMGEQKLQVLPLVVSHRECAQGSSKRPCLAKTQNKHCRFWFVAHCLDSDLVNEMESASAAVDASIVGPTANETTRASRLVSKYGWEVKHAKKIIGFAPEVNPSCILVNATESCQYMEQVAEHVLDAFRQFCAKGPICGEPLRGVRIDVVDAKIHSESSQRRAPQVVPACVRGMSAAMLCASPTLVEPIYNLDIEVPLSLVGKVHQVLSNRRGKMLEQEEHDGGTHTQLLALIPVCESIGLTAELREKSHGEAFHACHFSHWEMAPGDVYDADSYAARSAFAIRARRGLASGIPKAESLMDKL